ncbi:thrombospondin type 3 repeat-containing protein [Candidatus Woesearchaeota archaeon]|nr:thrombospondin type 3 repeat-containing protein [Candidatus Woesearchaeota archaeon]
MKKLLATIIVGIFLLVGCAQPDGEGLIDRGVQGVIDGGPAVAVGDFSQLPTTIQQELTANPIDEAVLRLEFGGRVLNARVKADVDLDSSTLVLDFLDERFWQDVKTFIDGLSGAEAEQFISTFSQALVARGASPDILEAQNALMLALAAPSDFAPVAGPALMQFVRVISVTPVPGSTVYLTIQDVLQPGEVVSLELESPPPVFVTQNVVYDAVRRAVTDTGELSSVGRVLIEVRRESPTGEILGSVTESTTIVAPYAYSVVSDISAAAPFPSTVFVRTTALDQFGRSGDIKTYILSTAFTSASGASVASLPTTAGTVVAETYGTTSSITVSTTSAGEPRLTVNGCVSSALTIAFRLPQALNELLCSASNACGIFKNGQQYTTIVTPNPDSVSYTMTDITCAENAVYTLKTLDSDRDGIIDTRDNCPTMANTDQSDIDADAIGDVCDPDDDNDGIADVQDNCPVVANADQNDFDADAIGDVCDPDDDNDLVLDTQDACAYVVGIPAYKGCPYAEKPVVDLQIVDQTKSGVCGYKNGKPVSTCKQSLSGITVKAFNRQAPEFVSTFGSRPVRNLLNNIYEADIGKVGACMTDPTGTCVIGVPAPNDGLIIAKFTDAATGQTVYAAKFTNFENVDDEEKDDREDDSTAAQTIITKRLHISKLIKKDATVKYSAGFAEVITGSKLTVMHPEYTVWSSERELYPFVFESADVWNVDICMNVPPGYVVSGVLDENGDIASTTECLQALVAGEPKVFVYDLLETGSPEPDTSFALTATHDGKTTATDVQITGIRAENEAVLERAVDAKIAAIKAGEQNPPYTALLIGLIIALIALALTHERHRTRRKPQKA